MVKCELQRISYLTFPKGNAPKCQITGLPASVACITPHTTLFYSTFEHAEKAQCAIIPAIACALGRMHRSQLLSCQQDVTSTYNEIIATCEEVSKEWIVEDHFDLAISSALHALSFRRESSCESEEPHLLIAEAYLGLFILKEAGIALAKAEWFIRKHPYISNCQRSRIHRNYGKLFFMQGYWDRALQEFAKGVYISSLQYGPESAETSIGYALMVKVLGMQKRGVAADSFASKVVEIWKTHFARKDQGPLSNVLLKEGTDALETIKVAQEGRHGASYPLQKEVEALTILLRSNFELKRNTKNL